MVDRYTPNDWPYAGCFDDPEGGWVTYYDYEKLQAACDAAISEIGAIGRKLGECQAERYALKAELDAIRQALCDSYKHSDDLK